MGMVERVLFDMKKWQGNCSCCDDRWVMKIQGIWESLCTY